MAKKAVSQAASSQQSGDSSEKAKRKRKVQPVSIRVLEAPEGAAVEAGHLIEDASIHDMASAGKFIKASGLDGKFEVVKILGTIEVKAEVKRTETIG